MPQPISTWGGVGYAWCASFLQGDDWLAHVTRLCTESANDEGTCGRRECGAGAMDGNGLELRGRARTWADTAMDWDCPTQAGALEAVAETIVLRAPYARDWR